MGFAEVVDAWMTDLTTNVDGLTSAIRHRYSPWAVEMGYASSGERHIAIWPEGEPETVTAAFAGTYPADTAAQSYLIQVWEDASADSSRLQDDENAAADWLALGEAIRDRLYVWANAQLGSVEHTRYAGMGFDMRAGARVLTVRFNTRVTYQFS